MKNAGLGEPQAGIEIARRNITNLRYADDTTLMAESEEELKSLSMESERYRYLVCSQETYVKILDGKMVIFPGR